MDRKFVMTALGYGLPGLLLGIHMASSHNHGQLVTHAHIMLLGFVVSFIYGACYKLWLGNTTSLLATVQFYSHQIGTLLLLLSLFLMYGGLVEATTLEPMLGISSLLVLLGLVLIEALFIKAGKTAQ